jgi:hypothetical protein
MYILPDSELVRIGWGAVELKVDARTAIVKTTAAQIFRRSLWRASRLTMRDS